MFILQVRVKRLTRSQSAFVEFKLDKARPSKGYEFDVTFRDIGESRLPRQLLIYTHTAFFKPNVVHFHVL